MRTLQRSRIIERPRLLTLLDESTARVRTLFAAAGYGKTTLAEQWVTRGGRRSAWYTARSSSVDVAALALGVARSASTIVEGCESRLREHMRAISAAAGNVAVLAEILSEDLAEWPREAWLVIDDYQEIVDAFGGTKVRPAVHPFEGDREMWRAYDELTAFAASR